MKGLSRFIFVATLVTGVSAVAQNESCQDKMAAVVLAQARMDFPGISLVARPPQPTDTEYQIYQVPVRLTDNPLALVAVYAVSVDETCHVILQSRVN